MAQQTMYPAQTNSLQTELAGATSDTQTTITVLDASLLPAAPNLLVIGGGEDAETILYTGKTGNNLTGVTRGFQGTAKAWAVGVKVGRFFTAYDHDAFKANIEDHQVQLGAATSSATANAIIKRDASGQANVGTPTAASHIARKQDVDAAQSRATASLPKDGSEPMSGKLVVNAGLAATGYDMPNSTTPQSDLTFIPAGMPFYVGSVSNKTGYPHTYGVVIGVGVSSGNYGYAYQMFHSDQFDGLYYRRAASATSWNPWVKMWNGQNDGSGSGLDADTVRGKLALAPDGGVPVTSFLEFISPSGSNRNKFIRADNGSLQVLSSDFTRVLSNLDDAGTFSTLGAMSAPSLIVNGTTQAQTRINNGVLEFWDGSTWKAAGGVKNVQRGTATVQDSTGVTITISAVNLAKTFVNFPNSGAGGTGTARTRAYFIDSTNLRIDGMNGSWTWEVVEYY